MGHPSSKGRRPRRPSPVTKVGRQGDGTVAARPPAQTEIGTGPGVDTGLAPTVHRLAMGRDAVVGGRPKPPVRGAATAATLVDHGPRDALGRPAVGAAVVLVRRGRPSFAEMVHAVVGTPPTVRGVTDGLLQGMGRKRGPNLAFLRGVVFATSPRQKYAKTVGTFPRPRGRKSFAVDGLEGPARRDGVKEGRTRPL